MNYSTDNTRIIDRKKVPAPYELVNNHPIDDQIAKKTRIYVDGAHQVKANGQTSAYPIHPSNVVIITPVLSDKKRKEALARK